MKTNLLIIAIVATLVTACTTGTQMTRTYDDDIYFSPKDVPPVSMAQNEASDEASKSDAAEQRIIISQKEKNADGTVTLNNDIYQRDENADYQVYDLNDQDLSSSDTTVYYDDDSVKYIINNYYEDEDIDFAYRINRFHRPYLYDSYFYNDWYMGMSYYPFYSGYYGWGYDPWYSSSWGWGWGGYYGSYSPFGYGYWGYGGYNPYHYGYYNGYYSGYYNGYYGGGGGFYDDHQVARRRSTEMNMPRTGSQASNNQQGGTRNSTIKGGAYGNDSDQRLPSGVGNNTNSRTWVQNGHTRSRSINGTGTAADAKNATIVNNRRAVNASSNQLENGTRTRTQVARPSSATQRTDSRSYQPSTSGRTYSTTRQQSSNYTPSYSKPRVVNQPNYNNNSYSRSSRPASSGNYDKGTLRSGSTGNSGYSAPRSSSSMRQTYQSQSYQSRSSSSGNSYRSSGSDYSPSRSYSSSPSSSPSYDSGGSRSSGSSSSGSSSGSYSGGGGSSRGSSGGGGGSGHRR